MSTIESVIKAVAPKADPAFLAAMARVDVASIMIRHGITGVAEQAQLIGHMAVESAGFTAFAENLSYSAQRLHQVWPNRFPTVESAEPYAKNPQRLAAKVYNGRMGNREGSTDGYDFRGSGSLQHTGRSEFERVQRRTGSPVVSNPASLRNKDSVATMWLAACTYFVDRGALAPAKNADTRATCVKINGGTNGLADRVTCVGRATKAIGSLPISPLDSVIQSPPTQTPAPPAPVGPKTTAEEEMDAKKKRDMAITGAAGGSTGGTTVSALNKDWFVIGAVVILAAVASFLIVRHFWRKHEIARENVERLQLAAIQQRLIHVS